MNKTTVKKFKQKLLSLKSEIESIEESSRETTRPVELDQASIGRLSRMDALQGQQMAREAARRRQSQMMKIDGALRRIESGNYGHCFVCGEEIDVRRLSVDPTNTRCVDCIEK